MLLSVLNDPVAEAPAAAEAAPIRGKAILVVDDEPVVVEVLGDVLSIDGHAVDTAANGAAALDKIRRRPTT